METAEFRPITPLTQEQARNLKMLISLTAQQAKHVPQFKANFTNGTMSEWQFRQGVTTAENVTSTSKEQCVRIGHASVDRVLERAQLGDNGAERFLWELIQATKYKYNEEEQTTQEIAYGCVNTLVDKLQEQAISAGIEEDSELFKIYTNLIAYGLENGVYIGAMH